MSATLQVPVPVPVPCGACGRPFRVTVTVERLTDTAPTADCMLVVDLDAVRLAVRAHNRQHEAA